MGVTLQILDFTPAFRPNAANKWVVMITDAPPGGFCDTEDGDYYAHQYALQVHDHCMKINAILVADKTYETFDPSAQAVMQDYYHTACGWYSEVPHDGGDIVGAVLKMVYENGYCNCQ